jgi:hypothetical protein
MGLYVAWKSAASRAVVAFLGRAPDWLVFAEILHVSRDYWLNEQLFGRHNFEHR